MRITFIVGHLCKERHSLLNELVEDLGKYGAEVTVLTGYPERRITKEVRQYYLDHPIEKIADNVTVYRIGSKKGEGRGLFSRMLKYIFLTKKLYKEAKKIPTDVYYLYSTPPFLGYMGCRLAKRAPTLYNAQDLFTETLVHMTKMSDKNPLIAYLKFKERKVYEENTKIVTISPDMVETIVHAGCSPQKVEFIYNWAGTTLSHVDKNNNSLIDELGIDKSKFVVSYAGSIGLFQGWDFILDAAKILQRTNSSVEFVLIGNGAYKSKLVERIIKENINNVKVYPMQSAKRLSEVYSIGDIELVPIEKGVTKMALPSKTSVIMACGGAVLAIVDNDSAISKIINDSQSGLTVEHGSADKLVEAITYCYDHRDLIPKWGKNARHFALTNFSREKQTKKYYSILEKMVMEN